MQNPLLNFDGLPAFDQIRAEHALPALNHVLDEARATLDRLCEVTEPSWENFARPFEDIDERIGRVWSPISHLNSVRDEPELRDVYRQGIAQLTEYHVEVGQNSNLYHRFKQIADADTFDALNEAQQTIVRNHLRDFKLSGAELNAADKTRFAELSQQLSLLAKQLERNVLDATQAWEKLIESETELAGLPAHDLHLAKQLAEERELDGFLLTLQIPSYLAVMQHAEDRRLRETMYHAYSTRASDLAANAEFDNATIINDIVRLKQEKAALLGYANYAELSLVTKMAESVEAVFTFLHDLAQYAKPVAKQELETLTEFAVQNGHEGRLEVWDIPYFSERLREAQYDFTDEEVKPYFPVDTVFRGLFEIVQRLFGISIRANASHSVWHPDVQYFDVFDEHDALIGGLYTDLAVRQNKRGGAWMDTCIHRRRRGEELQHPVAFLTCNFAPAVGDQPALLTHDDVETLFHEFGHTLHHLLTKVDEHSVAGINGVEWDAVELPSQFLENWCWQTEGLSLIAAHFETGASLPDALLKKMRAAKHFQSGLQTLRQIEFALFDMQLHRDGLESMSVQATLDDVRAQVAVSQPPAYNRFQNSFGHIFAGGYAAGYYSYKWAEVLSADAFDAFLQEGIFNSATGRRFKQSVLERGGTQKSATLFAEFRGRAPQIEPLLQQSGILTAS